jgi:cbb3-type cytochrome oxidase cytochrome c subunit
MPKGTTKREKCPKCGMWYTPSLRGKTLQIVSGCVVCFPQQYRDEKQK